MEKGRSWVIVPTIAPDEAMVRVAAEVGAALEERERQVGVEAPATVAKLIELEQKPVRRIDLNIPGYSPHGAGSIGREDLFDVDASVVASLHARGRKVICYTSAGSWEDWRPDAASFPAEVKGKPLDGWPGERWLDTRDAGVRAVMRVRLDLAVSLIAQALRTPTRSPPI